MDPSEFISLANRRGKNARIYKWGCQLEICLFCGNSRWNLDCILNEGWYKCWACGTSGSLTSLAKDHLGATVHFPKNRRRLPTEFRERAHAPSLVPLTPAMEVLLERRGIDSSVIARYNIRTCLDPESRDYFLRAFWSLNQYWTGKPVGFLGRALDGRKPKYLFVGTDKEIVGYRTSGARTHVLVEGVIDGVKVHLAGYNAGVLLGTMSSHVCEWAALVPPRDDIVILLDGDAGAEADRLYWEIRPIHERVYNINLPHHMDPGMLSPSILSHLINTHLCSWKAATPET